MKDQFEQILSHDDSAWYAQTTEELAEMLGVPLENLQATIDQCNRDFEAGADSLYGKNPAMLHKIEPPFYAFELTAGYYTTVDGLLVDTHSRVLSEDGEPILGLYAAAAMPRELRAIPTTCRLPLAVSRAGQSIQDVWQPCMRRATWLSRCCSAQAARDRRLGLRDEAVTGRSSLPTRAALRAALILPRTTRRDKASSVVWRQQCMSMVFC